MILSVSRRTDIPCCYTEWFFNRLEEKRVYVRNPFNIRQIHEIEITPKTVDAIVFWTKNPEPMLGRLELLREFMYYFQFTLTGYKEDVEPALADKKYLATVFSKLAERIGSERVIWRYDPIFFNSRYTQAYHIQAFTRLAEMLEGSTRRAMISFMDPYRRTKANAGLLNAERLTNPSLIEFAGQLADIGAAHDIEICTCAEEIDLASAGIQHGCCIDKKLIEELTGSQLNVKKDTSQRAYCGCAESIDIGAYNTCRNGCLYCYANYSDSLLARSRVAFDVGAPILCSQLSSGDKVVKKKMKSLKDPQMRLCL